MNSYIQRLRERFRRSPTLVMWLGNSASIGLKLVQSVLVARLAGPHVFGIFAIATVYAAILTRTIDLGASNGLAFVGRARPETTRRLLTVSLLHCVLASPLIVVMMVAGKLLPFADAEVSELFATHAWAASALCIAQLFGSLMLSLIVPLQRYGWYAIALSASPFISVACVLGLAAGGSLAPHYLLLAAAAGEVVAGVICAAAILRFSDHSPASGSLSAAASDLYSFSIRSFPGQFLKFAGQRIDRLVLAALLPASAVGIYAFAVSLRDQVLMPMNTHALVVRNRITTLLQINEDLNAARAYLRTTIRNVVLVSVPLSLAACATSPVLLPLLFGPQFAGVTAIAMVLFMTIPLIAVANCGWSYVLADASPGLFSLLFTVTTSITVACLIAGAHSGGLMGTAVGALIASAIATVVWLTMAQSLIRRRLRSRDSANQAV